MASSSAPASVFDNYHFREVLNQTLFESTVWRKKIIPKVGFNLNEDEYPQIKEQIALRGWRRLGAPMTGVSKLLVQEFYANAAVSDEEVANAGQLPYKSFVRGVEEFIIHSLVPTGNKSEITMARALLIHFIMRGEDVRAEDIIADNMVVIAQGLQGKGNLSFPSTIYKLCKDAGVPLREFRRTSKILEEKLITAKRMESTRIPRNVPAHQQDNDDEDEVMPQARRGNEEEKEQRQQHQHFQQPPQQPYQDFQPNFESQYHQDLQGIEEHLSSMQFLQQIFYENMQKLQAKYMEEVKQIKAKQEEMWNNTNRFHSQIRKEQKMLAHEIQEVRKSQINQTLVNNQRAETEKSLQQAVEKQPRDISEMRKQLNLWTRNTSAREAYTYWAHQQANRNLSEIPVTHIPDLMQTNAKKGRPMFFGALKSDYGASSSSQPDQQELVPLRTAPPIPRYQPPRPPPN
ncbi:hypothetical protein PIB30_081203 [Stylosanthes scabra]|uniref:Putative plant transposon protein domain-containing protein n=1 Tax=Stylosanthes scabra TaxID=79078 RepID=A0ABU6ZQF0_9FABA|nr:hypothetical protein [Stylosanthes scabra]